MYSVYLRGHDGAQEAQTRTGAPDQALAAYRALLARRDLDGQPIAAVLRDQARGQTLIFSRFDMPDQRLLPSDPIDLTGRAWTIADVDTRELVAARGASDDSWAALLRRYRTRRGLTQPQAAAALGVNVTTFRGWESGGRPGGNAEAIGRALLLDLDGPVGPA